MLRFTKEQQDTVIANRRMFNKRQEALANSMESGIIGNAFTIPYNIWGMWDKEGIEVQRQELAIFNDLAASVAFPMPIGKLVHNFQTISDSGNINISLDGRSKARTDKPVFAYYGTPLPIVDTTFSYGWREVEAARTEGIQLDAAGRMNSLFKVTEGLEMAMLDGWSGITVGATASYGFRTHPKRNTRATGVALASATGAQWLAEILATLKLLQNKNFKAPATLYLNWADWFYASSTDYSTLYPGKTILSRVMESGGIAKIVPSDKLTPSQIIAFIKDRRTVQLLSGMPISTRAQFRENPEDDYNFVTMAAAALEIKFDATDQCGIAVST